MKTTITRTLLLIALFLLNFSYGQKITTDLEYLVHEPLKKGEKAPVIIMLHGYGSNEADLFELSKTIGDKFYVFSLRAPFKGKDVGYAWYDLNFLPNKQLSYNYEQLGESKAKILSFISNACKTYKADSNRVILMGFSQGAITAYEIALTNPKKIKGVIALSGRMLEETKQGLTDQKEAQKLKLFIGHGYSDNIIDIKEAEKANEFLTSKGFKEISFKRYEMPHSISGGELNDIKTWLKKFSDPSSSGKK